MRIVLVAVFAFFLIGCASPEARIQDQQPDETILYLVVRDNYLFSSFGAAEHPLPTEIELHTYNARTGEGTLLERQLVSYPQLTGLRWHNSINLRLSSMSGKFAVVGGNGLTVSDGTLGGTKVYKGGTITFSPVVSSDGKMVAYLSSDRGLAILNLDNGTETFLPLMPFWPLSDEQFASQLTAFGKENFETSHPMYLYPLKFENGSLFIERRANTLDLTSSALDGIFRYDLATEKISAVPVQLASNLEVGPCYSECPSSPRVEAVSPFGDWLVVISMDESFASHKYLIRVNSSSPAQSIPVPECGASQSVVESENDALSVTALSVIWNRQQDVIWNSDGSEFFCLSMTGNDSIFGQIASLLSNETSSSDGVLKVDQQYVATNVVTGQETMLFRYFSTMPGAEDYVARARLELEPVFASELNQSTKEEFLYRYSLITGGNFLRAAPRSTPTFRMHIAEKRFLTTTETYNASDDAYREYPLQQQVFLTDLSGPNVTIGTYAPVAGSIAERFDQLGVNKSDADAMFENYRSTAAWVRFTEDVVTTSHVGGYVYIVPVGVIGK